jgi:predicted nucleic acid-binding protein
MNEQKDTSVEPAFWDTSALVPLCVNQEGTALARRFAMQHALVVWWATPVETRSAFSRLARMNNLSAAEFIQAQARLHRLRQGWREIQPTESLRAQAESLLDRYHLRAADALQLAAAYTWAMNRPDGRAFISGDKQLLQAARVLGFHVIEL